MLTIKLNIKQCSDFDYVHQKQVNYSYAFRKLYKHYNKIKDSDFINHISEKYNLTQIETRSLISEVKTRFKQTQINKDDLEEKIIEIQNKINNIDNNLTKNKQIRKIFKLKNKLSYYNKQLSKDIVFGGKHLLRQISYLNNNKEQNQDLIQDKLKQYKENRIRPFYIVGEANQGGNRFFAFDFKNKTIIYKPNRNKKIIINVSNYSTKKKELLLLQQMIKNKEIAITVYLSTNNISITFDDEKLYGFALDEKERRERILEKTKNIQDKKYRTQIIKNIYKDFYKEQEQRKLNNKLSYRYLALDTNPDYIGGCILDKTDNKQGFKIVDTFYYDLTKINKKLPKNKTIEERKHHNNKKLHGIRHVYKNIFEKFMYYKCGCLVVEDLMIKTKDLNNKSVNRKINNVWHREESKKLIQKYCNKHGIMKIEINPIYTSFIGNLLYDYIDPINASIEIGRRGIYKYKKNCFYPKIDMGTIIDTMSRLNENILPRDVQMIKDQGTWVSLYMLIKTTRLRYRAYIGDCKKSFRYVHNIDHSLIGNYHLFSNKFINLCV